ncbi:putative transcriptional regulator [Promicromonospora umidemergens]|uniref:BlaI/MecI/CopY family transcriptional regulator n=1 Tax=Promicromonospora umidemergens TaxID=629679 RepID=A0ABP8WDH6_9MICO|nr:BlaI/MecI/CopY family transcriptional regulator [Promicromonospora umidemergens]MCP2285967.1 putative transcriptional regulator [Promicromonospora umidemergens]
MNGSNRAPEPPRLGALESQVMDVLWDHGPATIRGIINQLPGDLAYTTIATVLTNLDRKQLVSARKEHHSTLYTARAGREEHVAAVMRHALGTSSDRAASILHFVDTIPASDLDLLRDYLRQREGGAAS